MSVSFQGGVTAPKKVRGTFVTASPSVQEAMDNDIRNGQLWKCIKGGAAPKKKAEKRHPAIREEDIKDVPDIQTIQDAKEFLLNNVEGLDSAALTNKRVVLETATLAGYRFPSIK